METSAEIGAIPREQTAQISPTEKRSPTSELEQMRQEAFERLQTMGVLDVRTDENNQRYLILNDPRLFRKHSGTVFIDGQARAMNVSHIVHRAALEIFKDDKFGAHQIDRSLYFLFQNERVTTGDDFTAHKKVGTAGNIDTSAIPFKSFFYVPETEADAFNPEKLAAARGHYLYFLSEIRHIPAWNAPYPTKEKDYDSQLRMFDTVIAEIVWGKGLANRDQEGNLTVISDTRDEKSPRQNITGRWLVNAGLNTIGKIRFSDTPRMVIETMGKQVIEKGLLTPEDFSQNEARQGSSVDNRGNWYLPGSRRRFFIGRIYGNCQVERVSEDGYIVSKDSKPLLWFSTQIEDKKIPLIRTDSSGSQWVPSEAFPQTEIEKKNFKVIRYHEGKRLIETINMEQELPRLLEFRHRLETKLGSSALMNKFSLEDQVGISHLTASLDFDRVAKFISAPQAPGLLLLTNGFRVGKFDSQILEIASQQDRRIEAMFGQYRDLTTEVQKLSQVLQERLRTTGLVTSLETGLSTFISRSSEAFFLRADAFFTAAATGQNELIELAQTQLGVLTDSLKAISTTLSTPATNLQVETFLNQAREGNQVTSVTWKYLLPSGEEVKVTVRPEKVDGHPHEQAQAGFRISYLRPDGEGTYLRIDNDDHGTSLDLGSRGSRLHEMFSQIGQSHHTQETFDQAYSNPQLFARYLKALSQALGYTF